jgi:hypothetical protein
MLSVSNCPLLYVRIDMLVLIPVPDFTGDGDEGIRELSGVQNAVVG